MIDHNHHSVMNGGRRSGVVQDQRWLVTFADLAALMVAFFALMFSMGEIDAKRWNASEAATDSALAIAESGETPAERTWQNIDTIDTELGHDLSYLASVVGQQIDELESLAGARIKPSGDRLIISLPQALLFSSGRAQLQPGGSEAIFALSSALSALSNDLEIVGHTDPAPAAGERWPSNWELSLTRAAVVANELRRSGYAKPIRISGAGSGRFEMVNPRLPKNVRYTLARRVDIVVRSADGDSQ